MNDDVFDHESYLKNLTSQPGVYRMLNERGEVIYVGKAKNLKRRVSSYFSRADQSPKTRLMVGHIRNIEVTTTHTENEALILENNLIKKHRPQYNILYRDDKSYPYIFLSTQHEFPRLGYYRGARRDKGRYFGPFPSAGAAKESLNLLQKLFPVRQCEDSFFSHRSRPCLEYQIKRCSAPCVDYVSQTDYAEHVRHAVMFLEGKNTEVIDELVRKMEQASARLEFEHAAKYRDQIGALRVVQEKQYVTGEGSTDIDVVVAMIRNGIGTVQVFFIRGGNNLGNKSFFPKHSGDSSEAELLSAFIGQYYVDTHSGRALPVEIICNQTLEDADVLQTVLSEQAGRKVVISANVRGDRARWVKMALQNAEIALVSHIAGKANMLNRYSALQESLSLDVMPQRIECFDISHTMGEETVASCVVFDQNGPLKSDYRLFNISDITPGDDYAAMHQALQRRFKRAAAGEGKLPDILLIDGARGQLAQAESVLKELDITQVTAIGVSKGVDRKAGMEVLWLSGESQPFILPADSPALHLIQHVRDEAHRFAISGHRARRAKKRQSSPLEEIPGLGPKRRQQILRQFGGIQGVSRAGVDDLANVKGISKSLAQKIYDIFHLD